MNGAQIRERLEDGTPFRLGELARAAGYSREHLRKLADAGVVRAARLSCRAGSHRRITVEEAERFLRAEGLLP